MAWGRNEDSELGDDSTNERDAPVPVRGMFGVKQIVGIANGSASALTGAVTTDLRLQMSTSTSTTVIKGKKGTTTATNITYTIVVTNAGSMTVPGFQVRDVIPAGTTFVSAASVCAGVSPGAVGTELCNGIVLSPGQSTSMTLTVQTTGTASVTNTASIVQASVTNDTDPSNDAATITTTFAQPRRR
jgi:uncharacterized repeat protein (TIGR01451 family)